MNVTKLLLATVITLGLGLTACSNDDDIPSSSGEEKNNTNVSVTLKLSQRSDVATTKSTSNDNSIGAWAGKDKIKDVTVYLVYRDTVTVHPFKVGTDDSAGYTQETSTLTNDVVLKPKKSISTTSGIKKVYVLINGEESGIVDRLPITTASAFEAAYKATALYLENSGAGKFSGTSAGKLVTTDVDKNDETIMMTNTSEITINLAPNVTAEQALDVDNPQNRVSVSVERAVARVMVTTTSETYNIISGTDVLGSINDINWVLAQGESSLYIQRKTDWDRLNYGWVTPNYEWVPTSYDLFTETEITGKSSKYDYSGLFEGYTEATQFGGTPVPTMNDYEKNSAKDKVTNELNIKLSGKFILPNTHKYATGAASSYKKGNTAYVLVRAKFTPKVFADAGNDKPYNEEPYKKGDDFYLGANGKFYRTAQSAITPSEGGVEGQTVAKYVGGKVLYYAWVNPDVVPAWYNSPVLRNNIYHIHISGFNNLGTNWNPLFPENPNNLKGGDDTNKLPLNPDPKPVVAGVNEPQNPIDPTHPLTTPETWMSVDVKVLPWILHSYEVNLGI